MLTIDLKSFTNIFHDIKFDTYNIWGTYKSKVEL